MGKDNLMTSSHFQTFPRFFFLGSVGGFLLLTFCMAEMGPIGRSVSVFSGLYAISFVFLWFIFKTFPGEWPAWKQFFFIFFLAFLCRLFFLTFPAAYDINRYIWEGYIYNQGFNPYLHAPNDPVLRPLVNDIWHNINHKDASACYPPLVMLLFSLMASISQSPLFFKSVMILFDLAVIPVLFLMARSRGIASSRLVFYALNPLVLVFIAGEGHLDSIHLFFTCLSLYFFMEKRDVWGFLTLGCAIMSKYFAFILLPFLINGRNWKKCHILLIPLLFYLPFWDSGLKLFSSLVPFGTIMHYNDSLTVILRTIFGGNAVWASLALFIMVLGIIFIITHDPLRSSYLAFGWLLLLLSTLHPWYLLLITPFLVIFPSRAWMCLHISALFMFPVLGVEYQTGVFQEIHYLKIFEYLPFYGLLIFNFIKPGRLSILTSFQPVANFSVIIPTLNEARNISGVMEFLGQETNLIETIVVDGGSKDKTRTIATDMGAYVITGERGRGFQIKKGIDQCHGDIILILHADCRIRQGVFKRIKSALNGNPQYIGGALGMSYSSESFTNRFLAQLNNGRARWTGIAFGDQGQFFRKEALGLMGGFPDQMLMEDVELSLRLKEKGLLCYISKGVTVSARRWAKIGFFKNFSRVVTLCLTYLVLRRLGLGNAKRKDFYKRYYGRM